MLKLDSQGNSHVLSASTCGAKVVMGLCIAKQVIHLHCKFVLNRLAARGSLPRVCYFVRGGAVDSYPLVLHFVALNAIVCELSAVFCSSSCCLHVQFGPQRSSEVSGATGPAPKPAHIMQYSACW